MAGPEGYRPDPTEGNTRPGNSPDRDNPNNRTGTGNPGKLPFRPEMYGLAGRRCVTIVLASPFSLKGLPLLRPPAMT
jgi:hypothetical protein